MLNNDLVWEKLLNNIKTSVNSIMYTTWFQTTKLHKLENGQAIILVKNEIQKNHLRDKYYDFIQSNLQTITNMNYDLIFKNEDDIKEDDNVVQTNLPIAEAIKEDKPTYKHKSNLNKELTFDSFVVGNSNRLAQHAALAVAEDPGKTYNPLFIYGPSGLGKTHLMHAIGNYIEDNSDKRVLYVTSQQFMDEFSKLGKQKDEESNYEYAEFFKNKYHNIDVLIIDDIQCISSGQKTQMEFFHTFNDLHDNNKQIVLSSDRSPNDMKQMEERLKTRFNWGLTADIHPPELELRKNILKKKINNKFQSLKDIPEEVIDYIATNIASGDVRILENSLNRLMAYSTMWGINDITLKDAVEALKDLINKGTSEQTNILRIQKVVADNYQISVDDLKSKKRSAIIAYARQIAMYLARDMLNEPLARIGLEFGGRDHTTVIHACEKITEDLETKQELKNEIDKIRESLI